MKKVELRDLFVYIEQIVDLTTAFPSLESLSIDRCFFDRGLSLLTSAARNSLFQLLGGLENFHTLELDAPRELFATDITTESGPSTIVTLSALARLRTLLVPVDFFVGFEPDNEPPHIRRENTVLPESLRHLTLLLNFFCGKRLSDQGKFDYQGCVGSVILMVGTFLREVAPALLIEFPHLERVDLCYDMRDYRQNKVHPLVARFPADGHVAS